MFHLNNRIFNKFLKLHSVFKYFSVQAMAKPRVVFVLGAPGSGKGTQCEKIVEVMCCINMLVSVLIVWLPLALN